MTDWGYVHKVTTRNNLSSKLKTNSCTITQNILRQKVIMAK